MVNITKGYHQNLFTSSNRLEMERVIELVDHVVTEEMAQSLVWPYTKEEMIALFQMHSSKAPRPDDISPFFF